MFHMMHTIHKLTRGHRYTHARSRPHTKIKIRPYKALLEKRSRIKAPFRTKIKSQVNCVYCENRVNSVNYITI